MKLQTIRLEGFKRFRDPITIADLTPGINLFAGPNGKGKSTIAEAVRAAFLERHNTASLGESLAPWSQPGATPTVQIQFERQGKAHRLDKTFGRKMSCSLVIDGAKPLTGEEAEQHLMDLLSFEQSRKGVSKPELQGVPGLLWVGQGTAGQITEQVDSAHEYISRALGDDLGQLVATEGDRVIDRVTQDLAQLHSLKTGKPTGEFARASEELAAKTTELAQMKARVRQHMDQVDRFASLQQQHAQGERERPWEQQRGTAQQSREKLQALAGVEARQREVLLQIEVTKGNIERLQSALATLDADDRAVSDRQGDFESARQRADEAKSLVSAADAALKSAREEDESARAQAAAARRAATKASHEQALEAATRRKGELEKQLGLVQAQQEQLSRKQADTGRLAAFARAGARLATKESALATARAKLEAASTRLEYDLHAPGIRLDGEALSAAGSRTIAKAAEIVVEGIGRIRVLPGSKDLAQLQADGERAQQELAQLLEVLGAATADEARAREQELADAEGDVKSLTGVIAAIAPDGLEALSGEVSAAQGEVKQHQDALALVPQSDWDGPLVSVGVADAREKAAKLALRTAQEAYDDARNEEARTQEQLRLAGVELEAARTRVAAGNREELRGSLSSELVTAGAQLHTQQGDADELGRQIDAAQPGLLENDITRLTSSADALEAAHGQVKTQLDSLAGELKAQGALGLQEEAGALEEEVARLQRQVADRKRRAAALTYLLKVLGDKRAEAARGIRAPLQRHMSRYLAIQFPGASIELDEGLRPQRISRPGPFGEETGTFGELSGGEREQLGVIARLAYADLLKEAGKPTLVMLDDSLVNCDLARLDQMKRVIFDAAQRHQILIFTCHEELWRDLGVAPRALQ